MVASLRNDKDHDMSHFLDELGMELVHGFSGEPIRVAERFLGWMLVASVTSVSILLSAMRAGQVPCLGVRVVG